MPAGSTIVLTTLAFNQTVFLVSLAEVWRDAGWSVVFISFHDRSIGYIERHDFRVFRVYDVVPEIGSDLIQEAAKLEATYRVNLNTLTSHERYFYGESSTPRLLTKAVGLFRAVEAIFDQVESEAKGSVTVVQELGGVLGLLACYYVARNRGHVSVFIEPAFIRGRLFFLRDRLAALRIAPPKAGAACARPEVRRYIAATIEAQEIVIPAKDQWKHGSTLDVVFNQHRVRRLIEKLIDKWVLGYREEFDGIGRYVGQHLTMFRNRLRLRGSYARQPPSGPFLYYPLHVPADMALTLRSPEYLDQYALLDYVARILPLSHTLVLKEHPALVGGVEFARIRDLLGRHDNVVLVQPGLNNFELLRSCEAVLTINSKAGAEALLLHKQVVVLGDAFYKDSGLVHAVERLGDLERHIRSALGDAPIHLDDDNVAAYVEEVWKHAYPGELYVNTDDNIAATADSLLRFLGD